MLLAKHNSFEYFKILSISKLYPISFDKSLFDVLIKNFVNIIIDCYSKQDYSLINFPIPIVEHLLSIKCKM